MEPGKNSTHVFHILFSEKILFQRTWRFLVCFCLPTNVQSMISVPEQMWGMAVTLQVTLGTEPKAEIGNAVMMHTNTERNTCTCVWNTFCVCVLLCFYFPIPILVDFILTFTYVGYWGSFSILFSRFSPALMGNQFHCFLVYPSCVSFYNKYTIVYFLEFSFFLGER